MALDDRVLDQDLEFDNSIVCPHCHDQYTSIIGVAKDKAYPTDHTDRAIEIAMRCDSCKHKFAVIIHSHEGNTYVSVAEPNAPGYSLAPVS